MVSEFKSGMSVRLITTIMLAGFLAACGGGGSKRDQEYDDQGKPRIPILSGTGIVEADTQLASLRVSIPAPYVNKNWAQVGGDGLHLPQHLSLPTGLSLAWQADGGAPNRNYERTIDPPVSADGRVFNVDSEGGVIATSLATGERLWMNELEDGITEQSDIAYGGGVAYGHGRLYVTSGYGFVVALEPATGAEIWRADGLVPLRGAPTVSGDKIITTTQDNLITALDYRTGDMVWDQVAIAEAAGMLGAASPASDGDTVIAALSSGELMAMLNSNGRVVWQDSLSSSRRLTPLSTLTDIDGEPVIAGDKVIAASHAGRMVAIDMRTGERSWEADVASVHMPWVAGDYIFVVTIDGQVLCMTLRDGRVRWAAQLQRFQDQEKRRGLITWNGPVLAGNRLIVTSSHGYAVSLSPYTGEVQSAMELPAGSYVDPVVVDDTLLILTEDADILAYR